MQTTDDGAIVVVAQLGCGYWGPNLVRNFSANPGCRLKWVAERDPARRDYVATHFPRSEATPDAEVLLRDPEVEAVVIATPAAGHYAETLAALEAGKHVFVEKPLALTTREADRLVDVAREKRRVLMVGHTFLYNPAVRYLKGLVDGGELGEPYYLYSQRLNLGQVRSDVNAWWNLAPHDVSILLYLMNGELPVEVTAQGVSYIRKGIEDVVFATLTWPSGVAAHVHVSWLDPGKVRKVTLVGSRRMVVYDDISEDKILVLDKGVDRVPRAGERMDYDDFNAFQVHHRSGDAWLPRVRFEEPLKIEVAHFLECVRTGATPLTGPSHARDVVAVLEAGQEALRSGRAAAVPGRPA